MIDLINKKTLIRNIILSSIAGILIPFILVNYIDRNQAIFDFDLMISNGIIFIIIYTGFGLFKKNTFIRLAIGIGYILLLVYFYEVGSNVFTLYLPHCGYGVMCVNGNILGIKLLFALNYAWMIVILITIKSANLVRHYLEEPEEDDGDWVKEKGSEEKKLANINILK